ncbi:MAG: hypothetical protein M3076_07235 [Actinomycetota bacterium]|nr:hypothetical protein [Actinomycetota bacterium]
MPSDRNARQEYGAQQERRAVARKCPAGVGRHHQDPAQGRTNDPYPSARRAIPQDPTGYQDPGACDLARGNNDSERDGPRYIEHRKGHGDRPDRIAERGGQRRSEQQPVRSLGSAPRPSTNLSNLPAGGLASGTRAP